MSRKTLLLVLFLALIVGGFTFFLVIRPRLSSPKKEPEVKSETPVALTEWVDPAGFKFSYPKDLALDPHREDQENYAHLELVSTENSGLPVGEAGRLIIWVQDTEDSDLEKWVANQPQDIQVFETELGGLPAKKMAFSVPQKLVIAAIDVDALVLIEMYPESAVAYWQKVYDQIIASFEFVAIEGDKAETAPAKTAPAKSPVGSGGQVIEEAEEVIE